MKTFSNSWGRNIKTFYSSWGRESQFTGGNLKTFSSSRGGGESGGT